jgi:flagella basal body P-ring formation protein FlgA
VTKGNLVTIEMRNAGMSLSTQGKALEEGSLGDVIRVTNISSNKIIEAKVNGTNRVDVTNPSDQQTN